MGNENLQVKTEVEKVEQSEYDKLVAAANVLRNKIGIVTKPTKITVKFLLGQTEDGKDIIKTPIILNNILVTATNEDILKYARALEPCVAGTLSEIIKTEYEVIQA